MPHGPTCSTTCVFLVVFSWKTLTPQRRLPFPPSQRSPSTPVYLKEEVYLTSTRGSILLHSCSLDPTWHSQLHLRSSGTTLFYLLSEEYHKHKTVSGLSVGGFVSNGAQHRTYNLKLTNAEVSQVLPSHLLPRTPSSSPPPLKEFLPGFSLLPYLHGARFGYVCSVLPSICPVLYIPQTSPSSNLSHIALSPICRDSKLWAQPQKRSGRVTVVVVTLLHRSVFCLECSVVSRPCSS